MIVQRGPHFTFDQNFEKMCISVKLLFVIQYRITYIAGIALLYLCAMLQ